MGLGEADTRAKLIDPKLHQSGWTEDHITREETAGENYIDHRGRPRKGRKRMDYVLRLRIQPDGQPVAVALIEAKAEDLLPEGGLEQVKRYQAAARRLNVPFVYSSNGHQFIEYDRFTGLTSKLRGLEEFPTPGDLRERYERGYSFHLEDEAAKPLLTPYRGGEGARRYYQDAAIRAALEKLANVEGRIKRGEAAPTDRRVLLSLATGAGKTFIAVNLLQRIAAAGLMGKALFICDRDELRSQASNAFQGAFGADAAVVTSREAQKNARVLIATYQTMGLETDDPDANFLIANYPPGFFSHIIIDECHRSGWGKWSTVFQMNAEVVQIGLTATPRTLDIHEDNPEFQDDLRISGDNVAYFGEPVYEYDLSQGIQDGYLAIPEIILSTVDVDLTGLTREDLITTRLTDATTGERITSQERLDELYEKTSYEDRLMLPDRVYAMAADLFNHLLKTGEPEQKTIIFCVRDSHAEAVAEALNNIYARWCKANKRQRFDPFAFKCTQKGDGGDFLADLRESSRSHFIATTVNLLEAGVDIPWLRNVAFFRYVNSPISFYQMLGRGTRVVPYPDYTGQEKLSFHVYDYTDATRLLGHEFKTKYRKDGGEAAFEDGDGDEIEKERRQIFRAEGVSAHVTMAGRFVVTSIDGKEVRLTEEEYRAAVASRLREQVTTLDEFRARWIDRRARLALLERLPNGLNSAFAVQQLSDMNAYDLYDVLAELAYGLKPLTRSERAEAFHYKHAEWLKQLPQATAATLLALSAQFSQDGTDGLENRFVWDTPEVRSAGGFDTLKLLGKPADVLYNAKVRIFAA